MLAAAASGNEAQWLAWQKTSQELRRRPDLKVYFDFEGLHPGDPLIPNRAYGADASSHGTVIGCDPLPGRRARKAALGSAKTCYSVRFPTSGTTPSITMIARVWVESLPRSHNHLVSMSPESVDEVHWKIDQSGVWCSG